MKRKWRIGRTVLAICLLGCGAAVFAFWPRTPRWTIPAEEVLGFDLSRNAVLTTSPDKTRSSTTFTIHSRDISTGNTLGLTTLPADQMAGCPPIAKGLVVAGGGKHIALWERNKGVRVYELPSGKPLELGHDESLTVSYDGDPVALFLTIPPVPIYDSALLTRVRGMTQRIAGVGFSPDGKHLVVVTGWGIVTWYDAASGEPFRQFLAASGSSSALSLPSRVAPTDDGHYLIASRFEGSAWALDGVTGRVLLETESHRSRYRAAAIFSRFYARSRVYSAFDYRDGKWSIRRFDCPDPEATWTELQSIPLASFESPISANSLGLVTTELTEGGIALPEWTPGWIRRQLDPWFGSSVWKVRVYDPRTAAVSYHFFLPVGEDHRDAADIRRIRSDGRLPTDMVQSTSELFSDKLASTVIAVPDGSGLIHTSEGRLFFWDMPPSRPLACWLTCGGLALLAAWVGWPRRVTPLALPA
jgi:hypothetical protein